MLLPDHLKLSTMFPAMMQCGNYGIGGEYGTHPDYAKYEPEGDIFKYNRNINRISTVMSVLDAPEAGGATVFPYLGFSVFPEKGSSIFWYNVLPSAMPDHLTQHAACPVLLGQKWSKKQFYFDRSLFSNPWG